MEKHLRDEDTLPVYESDHNPRQTSEENKKGCEVGGLFIFDQSLYLHPMLSSLLIIPTKCI